MAVGIGGIVLSTRASPSMALEWRVLIVLVYAVLLFLAMPWIGLLSVCTTGDCI